VVLLAVTGWVYLGVMVAGTLRSGHGAALGLAAISSGWTSAGGVAGTVVEVLCRPMFGAATGPATAISHLLDFALLFFMWCAMALAMMLPTALPMVLTYADIVQTAAERGEHAVAPPVLVAGYSVVWIGFAAIAALLQWALARAALLDATMSNVNGLFAGAIFVGAGLYQFSSLKHACVTRCQRPFPFFFANWTGLPSGIFRLGVRQGLYCLGCCWAMMLVMFAVGVMNVVWMVLLGCVMAIEKILTTTRFTRLAGGVLIALGLFSIGIAVVAHWPAASG
jgi:predicted metal-binding membrane protein